MAKKTKQAVAAETIEALDLDKTILVDGQPYNVNAVMADKVVNTLNINSSNSDESGQFDGSAPTTINVMSPSGGAFTGPITVPSHTSEFTDTDVLNFTDTVDVLLANIKNNAVVYNWENNNLDISLTDNAINSISIVSGGESNVDSFHAFNNSKYQQYLKDSASGATLEELKDTFYLPVYLYIGTKDNLVYCGIAGTEKANLLNINTASSVLRAEMANIAEKANSLTYTSKFLTNLESTESVEFDGSNSIIVEPGIRGTLGIENGGTGKESHTSNAVLIGQGNDPIGEVAAEKGAFYTATDGAAPNFGTLPVTCGGTGKTEHSVNAVLLGNNSSAFKEVLSKRGAFFATGNNILPKFGTLPVTCGGTGTTDLDNVTVGNSDNLGGKSPEEYQDKILTGTADPNTDAELSSAADGTIYIMYT